MSKPATITEYPVYFLSPRTGNWKIQHTFSSLENAKRCADNCSTAVSCIVNELVYEVVGRRIVSERQVYEAKLRDTKVNRILAEERRSA